MATLSLTWKDFNLNEDGFNIYRSETPMDVNNMPMPIATVGTNIGSYDDTTGIVGTTYYYRIGVIKGTKEKIGPELRRVFDNTINIHDVFGDGSAVATYNFDGNVTDLGGTYNGTWGGTESYVDGVIGRAADFSDSEITTPILPELSGDSAYTLSFWVFDGGGTAGHGLISIGSFSSRKAWGDYSGPTGGIGWDLFSSSTADTPEGVLSSKKWDHVVISYPGNRGSDCINHIKIYVNSVDLPLTVTRDGGVSPDITNPSVNINNYTSSFKRNRPIDQLRIINRALTQEEVNILYQEGVQFL